jgi:hypothetical protein
MGLIGLLPQFFKEEIQPFNPKFNPVFNERNPVTLPQPQKGLNEKCNYVYVAKKPELIDERYC